VLGGRNAGDFGNERGALVVEAFDETVTGGQGIRRR
jgi:hypothetical protein